jgi:ABC-type Na+ transport system ATPase subunit NatA
MRSTSAQFSVVGSFGVPVGPLGEHMETGTAVAVAGVSKRFDTVTAVDNLSLTVREGSVYGLLGPNGAGKTTTLRMVLRITIPDSGSIHMLGRLQDDSAQDLIGYLPEERGLYPRMKVREVLLFLAGLKGLSDSEARHRVNDWLERLEIASWADRKVIDLSKGMQQKVQFIAAVIHRPPVLILDEPFSGLDPVNATLIKDIMLELRQKGATIILSTHRMEQVEMMCDAICLINIAGSTGGWPVPSSCVRPFTSSPRLPSIARSGPRPTTSSSASAGPRTMARSRFGLQVDSDPLPLLERPHPLRRAAVPQGPSTTPLAAVAGRYVALDAGGSALTMSKKHLTQTTQMSSRE